MRAPIFIIGVVIIIISLSIPSVYAFDLSDIIYNIIEAIRDFFGLQAKPKIDITLNVPDYITTLQSTPASINLSVTNKRGSSTIYISGNVYFNEEKVKVINQSFFLDKGETTTVEIFSIEPIDRNVGKWKFEIEVRGENERGVDIRTTSGVVEVFSPPSISA